MLFAERRTRKQYLAIVGGHIRVADVKLKGAGGGGAGSGSGSGSAGAGAGAGASAGAGVDPALSTKRLAHPDQAPEVLAKLVRAAKAVSEAGRTEEQVRLLATQRWSTLEKLASESKPELAAALVVPEGCDITVKSWKYWAEDVMSRLTEQAAANTERFRKAKRLRAGAQVASGDTRRLTPLEPGSGCFRIDLPIAEFAKGDFRMCAGTPSNPGRVRHERLLL